MFRVALTCLMTLAVVSQATAADKTKKSTIKHSYSAAYVVQRPAVRVSCFPAKLQRILVHISKSTGHKLVITSGHRPHSGKSQHHHCHAADFRIPGVSEKKILAAARSAPGIGGVGRYCNGMVHVDIGPKRSWAHCRR
ncbi:YcbK family protein [Agrobacterium sp. ES01]|uniref:YcbK family protein n=1 Tax=Agrobacterium sp. ES01 TaxID=3420714 RepID=UPI003D0D06A7